MPEWERNFEDDPEQQDSCDNLTKSSQSTPSTKRKRKQTAQKSEAQKLGTTVKPKRVEHKMRFLVGKDNHYGKMNTTITISKEEIDRQFQYPGKNKVIKEYKNIKDFYSWLDEEDSEEVNEKPTKSQFSPKIYDLRTPLKKSVGRDNTEIVVVTDSSPDLNKKTRGKTQHDKQMATSNSHATWSMEVSPDEDNSRVKSSIPGELYCYKNDSNI